MVGEDVVGWQTGRVEVWWVRMCDGCEGAADENVCWAGRCGGVGGGDVVGGEIWWVSKWFFERGGVVGWVV